jgi:hypothetical protein
MKPKEKQQDFLVHLTRRTFDPSEEPVIEPSDKIRYYIVQFNKSLTGNERDRLQRRYKLSLKHYIPNFAFLERLDSGTLAALSEDPLHRASALFKSNDKISPNIGDHGPDSREQLQVNGVLIRVLLFRDVPESDFSKVVNAIKELRGNLQPTDVEQVEALQRLNKNIKAEDGSYIRFDPNEIRHLDDRKLGGQNQLVFFLPSLDLLPLIAKLDEVQWIEEVVKAVPDSATTITNLGPNTIAGTIQAGDPGSTPVWARNINGEGEKIGIIDDTYVDVDHCMFKDNSGNPVGPSHRKMIGFRTYYDLFDNDHGTHVAAIAAGDDFHIPSNHPHRGIAWNAKVSYDDQKRIGHQHQTLLNLLQNQYAEEVMIHSNSWHDDTTAYNNTAFNVDQFVWLNEDHFVCGSAANSETELLGPPGTAKNVLCVAAGKAHPDHLQHGDGQEGPTQDDRRKPEICAPGAGMRAALADSGRPRSPILPLWFS